MVVFLASAVFRLEAKKPPSDPSILTAQSGDHLKPRIRSFLKSKREWLFPLLLILAAGAIVLLLILFTGSSKEDRPAPAAETTAQTDTATEAVTEAEPTTESEPPAETEPVTEEQIAYPSHAAYMDGSDSFFSPDRPLSRAEAAVFVYRLFGGNEEASSGFYDVAEDSAVYHEIVCVSEYFPTVRQNAFLPDEPILREDLFAVLCSATGRTLPNELAYESAPYTAYALQNGWYDADETSETVTRGEAAHILNSLSGRCPDRQLLMRESPLVFIDVPPAYPYYADVMEATVSHDCLEEGRDEQWRSMEYEKLQSGLYLQDATAYYLQEDGALLKTPGLHEIPSGTVLVANESGRIYADDRLHLTPDGVVFCRSSGTILKRAHRDGYTFDDNGFYTSGDETLDGYVNDVYDECLKDGMTQEEMLRACFDYVREFSYLGRNKPLDNSVKTMTVDLAKDYALKFFETGKGDCYNFTAAFLFLARGLGYEAEAIVGYCGYAWSESAIAHGWVEITADDGTVLVCDPQLENYNIRAGISNEYYGAFMTTYARSYATYYPN